MQRLRSSYSQPPNWFPYNTAAHTPMKKLSASNKKRLIKAVENESAIQDAVKTYGQSLKELDFVHNQAEAMAIDGNEVYFLRAKGNRD